MDFNSHLILASLGLLGVVVTAYTYGLPTPAYITLIALLILYPLGFDEKKEQKQPIGSTARRVARNGRRWWQRPEA
jgi:hypothetical protein